MHVALGLLLCLALTPASADWFKLGESVEGIEYADSSTFRWNGDVVSVWTLQDLRQRHRDGELSRRLSREYDCKAGRGRILSFSMHAEAMGQGEILKAQAVSWDWRHYGPGTQGEALLKAVCALAATPKPIASTTGDAAVALSGRYHVDKSLFFPGGRDAQREALFLRALTEGAEGALSKPDARFSEEENFAVEYDAVSFVARSFKRNFWNYGIVLGKVGRWKESADALRQAIEAMPSHAGTWGNLGVARHASGHYRESAEAFDKAVLLDPAYFAGREAQQKLWQASREGRPVTP